MSRPDKPEQFETTVALTTDELEVYQEEVDDNAVTGRGRTRDVILPFDYSPDEAVTEQLRAAHATELYDTGEGELSSEPQLQSEPEPPAPPPIAILPPPVSIPIPTVSEPEALTPPLLPVPQIPSQPLPSFAEESAPGGALPAEEPPTMAPPWVLDYVLLCAVLTLVGLVVLFIQHRMLGSASPF